MNITTHAQARMQKRGIPPLVIDWLNAYGEELHDHSGAVILHFNKKSRRRLEKNVGNAPVQKLSEWLNSYAVIRSDGALVTVGIRYKRIKH